MTLGSTLVSGFEDVPAGGIDGGRRFPVEVDFGACASISPCTTRRTVSLGRKWASNCWVETSGS
jgi:hypothetical protein